MNLRDMATDVLPGLDDSDLVDAHVHSLRSDGTASTMQLASLARRSGLSAIVVTDHDVLQNEHDLKSAGEASCVTLLGGVELTVRLDDRTLHVLGYGIDSRNPKLLDACSRLREHRQRRWMHMVEGLKKHAGKLDISRLTQMSRLLSPGRRHLARELVRARLVPNGKTAFERYLRDDAVRMKEPWPIETAEGIALIHAAGGVSVLAHPPANLSRDQWRYLVRSGLNGIELRYPRVAKNHQGFLRERVREYDLKISAGSDYHGEDANDYLGSRTMTGLEWKRLLGNYSLSMAKMPSISTATPSGSETKPSAERA